MRNSNYLVLLFFYGLLFSAGSLYAQEGEEHPTALSAYKPVYFLFGNPYAKIQVSFKAQLVEKLPMYFGYTQLMMWNLFTSDPFFYDVNYNPMMWYRWTFDKENEQWVDLIPEEHESNGKGRLLERAWDRAGIAYHQLNMLGPNTKFFTNIKIWYPTHVNRGNDDPSNPNPGNTDITRYRGLYEVTLTMAKFMGKHFDFSDLTLRLYSGGPSKIDPTHGGQELTYRFKTIHSILLATIVFQVFHGYAEDMLDYQKEHWEFRAGFGF